MTGLIILAAGSSSRLGSPKQKLVFKGKTLLQGTINAAMDSRCKPIIIVIGANAEEIKIDIPIEEVTICYNKEWQEGMASSIRKGVTMLQTISPITSDVILTVSDQPFLDAGLLNRLLDKRAATGKQIIASFYSNSLGVPALFGKKFFPELLQLKGQEGAKKLLMKYKEDLLAISFPLGGIDIDTEEDYRSLISED
jgi:molybdenum cofactor cytidylyltransferase